MLLRPPLQLAHADQDAPSAVDDPKIGQDVALKVIDADTERSGCLRLGERDTRWLASSHSASSADATRPLKRCHLAVGPPED
jgi:hypothetical protein